MSTIVLPPIAMDMYTETFTRQRIASMTLQTLYDFMMMKLKNEPDSPIFHIKIVCERDVEYLAFRKAYDQYLLDFFVSQDLIQKYWNKLVHITNFEPLNEPNGIKRIKNMDVW